MKAGDVVTVRFPFSDLTGSKVRPAVVLASLDRGGVIACQITSNSQADAAAVRLEAEQFTAGGLRVTSYARSGKLFTAHQTIIRKIVGRLSLDTTRDLKQRVLNLIQTP